MRVELHFPAALPGDPCLALRARYDRLSAGDEVSAGWVASKLCNTGPRVTQLLEAIQAAAQAPDASAARLLVDVTFRNSRGALCTNLQEFEVTDLDAAGAEQAAVWLKAIRAVSTGDDDWRSELRDLDAMDAAVAEGVEARIAEIEAE